ncbi:MAG: hypothetical protein ACKVUT_14230 [Gaiella sp.]
MGASDGMFPVYVPKDRLPEVYELLGRDASGAMPADPSAGGFPASLLRRLVKESPPGMRVILEALAVAPDTWMGADDLAQALRTRLAAHGGEDNPAADWKSVAGTLGAFGRRFKNRYADEHPDWPFSLKTERERWTYSMSQSTAAQVLALLDELS